MAGLKSFRQQLAAEGRERSRALEQITNAEARSQEELEQIKMQSIQSARNLEKEAAESEAVQLKVSLAFQSQSLNVLYARALTECNHKNLPVHRSFKRRRRSYWGS